MNLIGLLEDPVFLSMLVPIVAIIVGGLVWVILAMIRHQERMAMIEKGMHPDDPDQGYKNHDKM